MKYTSLMSMRRFTSLTVVMTVLALVTWAEARPRLGVVIVVDQLCADQLTRYSTLFTGGIARLQNEGVGFAEAHHEHANAFTAVGHASIATGCNPNHHGIVGNDWYDRATGVRLNCCDDSTAPITNNPAGKGRSPRLLETSTISDWLKSQYPSSRVVALSEGPWWHPYRRSKRGWCILDRR